MKLKKIIQNIDGLTVKGQQDILISGISSDSRRIAPGNLFIAKRGASYDGTEYIPQAIANGATAVLTDMFNPFHTNIVQIIHTNVSDIESQIAANYYRNPSKELLTIGITGTNGKTTCAYLAKYLLDNISKRCGLISSIDNIIGDHHYKSTHTTPDVVTCHRLLREMASAGCKASAMEVSSHGLSQKRTQNIDFDIAIFTNLSPEHLDYHHTMEEYAATKNLLFKNLANSSHAIVNIDDPWHENIIKGCSSKIITYGLNSSADIYASSIKCTASSSSFKVHYQNKTATISWKLIGKHNIYNCLPIVAIGILEGIDLNTISKIISSAPPIPGRLERVPNPLNINIYVDYAVTPDALENIFQHLKPICSGKLIAIFGCGGERDRLKRPAMATISERYADFTIITDDNPRREDPSTIIEDIKKGFSSKAKFIIESDRKEAIRHALKNSSSKDIIVIAGKGHENYQIMADKILDFNDRRVAIEISEELATLR